MIIRSVLDDVRQLRPSSQGHSNPKTGETAPDSSRFSWQKNLVLEYLSVGF